MYRKWDKVYLMLSRKGCCQILTLSSSSFFSASPSSCHAQPDDRDGEIQTGRRKGKGKEAGGGGTDQHSFMHIQKHYPTHSLNRVAQNLYNENYRHYKYKLYMYLLYIYSNV